MCGVGLGLRIDIQECFCKKEYSYFDNYKQLRASVITNWLRELNLREVQYRAGHRFVSSTEKYKLNDIEGLKEDIERYHPI